MLGLRWSAARAGLVGYLSALLLALFFFGANLRIIAYAHLRALLLVMDVLPIIWAAFLLYRVSDEAGAIHMLARLLPGLTPDRELQAVLIAFVFSTFLQSVGGFGVPVAVTAPILGGLGFSPVASVLLPSIGHGWAVTFGSLGLAFQALISSTGFSASELAPPSALFLGIAGLISGFMVAWVAGGKHALRRLFFPTIVLGTFMGATQWLVGSFGPWNIAALAGGLAGMFISYLLARRTSKIVPKANSLDRPILSASLALAPYAVLVGLILMIQFIPPLFDVLGALQISFSIPQMTTSLDYLTPAAQTRPIPVFRQAGMVLLYAALISFWLYKLAGWVQPGAGGRIVKTTLSKVVPATPSVVFMVGMAIVMQYSGMTNAIAQGLAQASGSLFPLVSPWIGALGAFMTGSNTNSNVIFAPLQMRTSELLGLRVFIILAAQTAGGAFGSVLSPAKLVVGTSTAGMVGKEGEVLRHVLPYILAILALVSLMAWLTA
jgi:lactate permease